MLLKGTKVCIFLVVLVINLEFSLQDGSSIIDRRVSISKLERLCSRISKTRQLSDMLEIINKLKLVLEAGASTSGSSKASKYFPGSNWVQTTFSTTSNAHLCLKQSDSLLDLEPILKEDSNVCKKSHIDLMETYYFKHLKQPNDRLVRKFFKRYAYQVSFTCKKNLLHWLNYADKTYIEPEDYRKVMPWVNEDNLCRSIVKHDDDLITMSSTKAGPYESEKLNCDAVNVLSSIKSVSELAGALVEERVHYEYNSGDPPKIFDHEEYKDYREDYRLYLTGSKRKSVQDMLTACSKFEMVYDQTIMPIVRLAQVGHDFQYDQFDAKCASDKFIQRWFSITLICESVFNSRSADKTYIRGLRILPDGGEKEYIVVDDQQDFRIESMLTPPTIRFENAISDDLWITDYIPGRFEKMRQDVARKLIKALNLEDMKRYAIFNKLVNDVKGTIIRLTFVGLALVGLGIVVN